MRKTLIFAAASILATSQPHAAEKAKNTAAVAPIIMPSHKNCEAETTRYWATHPHDTMGFDALREGFFEAFGEHPPSRPQTYRDSQSGITFYVESDGRHLAAIDKAGRVLWVRNPFVDQDMCPYRFAHPYIYWIGAPGGTFGGNYLGQFHQRPDDQVNAATVKELNGEIKRGRKSTPVKEGARFIGLSFNSSNFGYVNIANGDYYDMGQN